MDMASDELARYRDLDGKIKMHECVIGFVNGYIKEEAKELWIL